MTWYAWIQLSAMFKQQGVRWCDFRWSIPQSIDYIWNSSIGLSRLLYAHIGYETNGAKMIKAFCRISYCLHDLIRLNSIVCHVQRARCTMMWFSMIDSHINLLMFEVCVLIGLFQLHDTDIAYEVAIWNITTGNWLDAGNDLSWRSVMKR